MKKGLAIGIIALLFVTSITPLTLGYRQDINIKEKEIENSLSNLRYLCTTPTGFNEYKYEYYKDMYLKSLDRAEFEREIFVNNDDLVKKDVSIIDYTTLSPLTLGPMNSSWPVKCHDQHHTGRSPYGTEGILYNEEWNYFLDGLNDNSPAIAEDGTIYIGGNHDYLYAINPDGSLKWVYQTNGLVVWTCPAIGEDGTIYFVSWDEYLYALNPDGTRKWKFWGGDRNSCCSPAIADDGTIYYGTFPGPWCDACFFAVNPDGTEKWRKEVNDYISTDPAIADDGTVYFGSDNNKLYAMNPNGAVKWTFGAGDDIRGPISIADDGTIYFGSWDYYLYALNPDGTLKWKTEPFLYGTQTNPSIGKDGTIYVGWGARIFAFEPDTGDVLWEYDVNGRIGKSSIAICDDGILYVGCEIGDMDGGEIIAVNPDGTERWRLRLSWWWCDDSSPAITDDGTIYICATNDFWSRLHALRQLDPDAPLAPTINGPTDCYPLSTYEYTFSAIDPNGDDIYYYIDWGDKEEVQWTGPFSSAEEFTVEHSWEYAGRYLIRARAKDIDGHWGLWNELDVVMTPRPEPINYFGLISDLNITDIKVNFHVIFAFNSIFPRIIPVVHQDIELPNNYTGYLGKDFICAKFS